MTITQTMTNRGRPTSVSAGATRCRSCLAVPEVGALVGAIVLFIFFAAVSPTFTQPNALRHRTLRFLDHRASWRWGCRC